MICKWQQSVDGPLPLRSPGFCLTFLPWGTPTHPPPIPSSFSHIVHHLKTPSLPFDMSLRFCNNSATQEQKGSIIRPYLIDGFSRGLCMAFKHIMYVWTILIQFFCLFSKVDLTNWKQFGAMEWSMSWRVIHWTWWDRNGFNGSQPLQLAIVSDGINGWKATIAQYVLCAVYFSAQPNKLRPILKLKKDYPFEHIFVPACPSAQKIHFFKF